jgi:hypothetical protein
MHFQHIYGTYALDVEKYVIKASHVMSMATRTALTGIRFAIEAMEEHTRQLATCREIIRLMHTLSVAGGDICVGRTKETCYGREGPTMGV